MLRTLLPLVFVCSLLAPGPALAWEKPAGSPPGWRPYWVQSTDQSDAFVDSVGDASFGQIPTGLFLRVDAPEQNGRLWAYNPLLDSWAWLQVLSSQRVGEPTEEEVASTAALLDPRRYLYEQAPDLAQRLDCIISGESGWDPVQVNRRSHAAGLAQFLPSTWAATPQGELGESPLEPQANIDAAIWLARTKGWRQWQVYVDGACA